MNRAVRLDPAKWTAQCAKYEAVIGRPVTVTDVADYVGVKRQTVHNWLSGSNCPLSEHQAALCDFFGCDLEDLFTITRTK